MLRCIPARLLGTLLVLSGLGCDSSSKLVASRFIKRTLVTASEGATLAVGDDENPDLAGASLFIPPGALEIDTYIELELGTDSIVWAPDRPVGQVSRWGPSGTRFTQPAELILPYRQDGTVQTKELFVQSQDENGERFVFGRERLGIDEAASQLRFPLESLGLFQPGAGCGSGSCASALLLLAGPSNPESSNEAATATAVSMMQFSLSVSGGEDVQLTSVTVGGSGSGHEATAVASVKLYRDTQGNGQVDASDVQLGEAQLFLADEGTVRFTGLSVVLGAGATASFVVGYDFSGAALPGQTFAATIGSGAALGARGMRTLGPVSSTGSASGPTKTILTTGSLTLTPGISNPGPSYVTAGASGVSMMQFKLSASAVEDVRVTSVSLATSGSGDEATSVSKVRLHQDKNANGRFDLGDVQVGTAQIFLADNGEITFALNEVVSAGGSTQYVVTYDFSAATIPGQTFAVAIPTGDGIASSGTASAVAVPTSGSAAGPTITIQPVGSLTVSTGLANPLPSSEAMNGSGISMMQFTLSASSVEDVKVTAVSVRASGTGNDATGVARAWLYRDFDKNGELDGSDGSPLGSSPFFGTYNSDNGVVTFSSLKQIISAGSWASFIVVYDFNSSAVFTGQTFAAEIQNGAAVSAVGVLSNAPIFPGGSSQGPTKIIETTGSLSLSNGTAMPTVSHEGPGASNVSMLQFTLQASTVEDVKVTAVTVRASGSGNDASAVTRLELFHDVNGNGQLDIGTDALLSPAAAPFVTYGVDNGSATFLGIVGLTIPAGSWKRFIVTYHFSPSAPVGQTFAAAIQGGAAVTASGISSLDIITPTGSASGPTKTLMTSGSLMVSGGLAMPARVNESASAVNVPMLQFTLLASTAEDVKVTSVTLRAGGSGDDPTAVANVSLVWDLNDNGQFDVTDTQLSSAFPLQFATDNGTAVVPGLSLVIPAGGHRDLLVVYDFAGTASPGETFSASIQAGTAIAASGVLSQDAIAPSGSASGPTKTIQTSGSLTLSAGPSLPLPTNEAASAEGVAMLQFKLAASTVEHVRVTAITLRASGTGQDATGVAKVRLYRDLNLNGRLDPVDTQIGDAACQAGLTYVANNGTATCNLAAAGEVVPAGASKVLLATYDFSETVLPGQTFAAVLLSGAQVSAVGSSSGAAITPAGSAGGATRTIQTWGTLTVSNGSYNPPATNEAASAAEVPMMQFNLAASTVESLRVTAITFRASGSGNDATAVAKVKLYRDQNLNGQLDGVDVQLGDAACLAGLIYSSDNGTATCSLSAAGEVVNAGELVSFIVTYDFAAGVAPGQTFAVAVPSGALVSAVGVTSAASTIPGGAATGNLKTIQ